MALAPTNGKLLEGYSGLVRRLVVARLRILAGADLRGRTAEELVQMGACDPVRIFVKNEPHSAAKLSEGRVRLIASVSLIDQIVERVLWGPQNDAEIHSWFKIPSKPGLGLEDEDTALLCAEVMRRLAEGPAAASDMSGWDFSVQEYEFDNEVLARNALNGSTLETLFGTVNANRMYCLSLSVFALSDGTLIAQRQRGIMKSGSYGTSSINSRERVMAAWYAGADWCIAAGDDALEAFIKHAEERYWALGHNLKGYDPVEGSLESFGFEFCSTWMSRGVGYPVDYSKSLFRLLHKKPGDQDALRQWRKEMRHSPHLATCEDLLLRVGWSTQN